MLTNIQQNQVTYTGVFKHSPILEAGFQFAKEKAFANYIDANSFANAVKHLQKKTSRSDVFEVVQDMTKIEGGDIPVVLMRNGKAVYSAKGKSVGENCVNAISRYVQKVLNKDVTTPQPATVVKKAEVDKEILRLKEEQQQLEKKIKIEVCNKLDNIEGKIR